MSHSDRGFLPASILACMLCHIGGPAEAGEATADTRGDNVPSDEMLRSVYCVGKAAGDDTFSLRIWCRPSTAVDEQTALRLAAAASCLESPQDLPIPVEARADDAFLAALSEVRARLAERVRPAVARHRGDPDFRDGYSSALEAELQQKAVADMEALGLFKRLGEAYAREFAKEGSCGRQFAAWLAQERLPLPPKEQWRRVIDVCAGPPADLSRHIVFHFDASALEPSRASILQDLATDGRFRACLEAPLLARPELAGRILALDGRSPGGEYRSIREAVQRTWEDLGVPSLIEAAIASGDLREPLAAFLESCHRRYPGTQNDDPPRQ